jgi:hypothetical protein
MERAATELFLKIGEQFALTATARARLGLAELHARVLATEITKALGTPTLRPVGSVTDTAAEVSPN